LQLDDAKKNTNPMKADEKKFADDAAQKAVSDMCLLSACLQVPPQLPVGNVRLHAPL